jgi:glycosyltransferase involved in cell wall biosynthesis
VQPERSAAEEPLRKLSIFISHTLMLTDHAQHGDGLVAYNFIRELARRGHELHVAVPEVLLHGRPPENVHIHHIAPSLRKIKYLEHMVRSRRLLDRIRRTQHIDLIHQLNPVACGLSLSMYGTGLPLVLGTFVGSWPERPSDASLPSRVRFALRGAARAGMDVLQQSAADALLITSPAAFNRVRRRDAVADKTFVVPHGIDTTLYRPHPEYATEPPRILFLNGLTRHKGIYALLEAFALVSPRIPRARLVIGGQGNEAEAVAAALAASPVRGAIDFLGHVPKERVPDLMARCTLHCLPSVGDPYPGSILEAMACGKPVVITPTGGVQYLVPEGGGRRVPPGDIGALADALTEILTSPQLQAAMGAVNRRVVEQEHTWEHVGDRLEAVYDFVLRRNPMSSAQLAPYGDAEATRKRPSFRAGT